jgi:hypothetical protein
MLPMRRRIGDLDVVVDQIDIRKDFLLEDIEVEIATGLQGEMKPSGLELSQKDFEIIRVQGAFTSRQRYPAMGVMVEQAVAHENFYKSLYLVGLANSTEGPRGTDLRAATTARARIPVDAAGPVKINGSHWAGLDTSAASKTLSGREGNLKARGLRLRTVAEDAAKRTAFEEDDGANARTVFSTAAFDLDDERKVVHRTPSLLKDGGWPKYRWLVVSPHSTYHGKEPRFS